jgi:hypothetical protein
VRAEFDDVLDGLGASWAAGPFVWVKANQRRRGLEPPEAPFITGASSPSGGPGGQGRPVCEWALYPLACQVEMAYCLAASVWYVQFLWLSVVQREGVGCVDFGRAQGSASGLEGGGGLDGHHSSLPEK